MESDACPGAEDDGRALKSLLGHLRVESNILDRMVYKNKNQHRRCHYFHSLLKVRRDIRLLLSSKLEDILSSTSQVIHGRSPSQRIFLLERLKNRTSNEASNFYERLLGVARLLSQMVEPILTAAAQISSLLAKSFFMGFCLTILSLLARLRVLVQQMLVECVSVFNQVTSISRRRHSFKLIKNGIEAFREYYPSSGPVISLECTWERDKFVLIERQDFSKAEEKCLGGCSLEVPDMQYQVLGFGSEGDTAMDSHDQGDISIESEEQSPCRADSQAAEVQAANLQMINDVSLKRNVAFVSVTASSESSQACKLNREKRPKLDDPGAREAEDPFFSLLTAGNVKSSLFG